MENLFGTSLSANMTRQLRHFFAFFHQGRWVVLSKTGNPRLLIRYKLLRDIEGLPSPWYITVYPKPLRVTSEKIRWHADEIKQSSHF